MPDDCRGQQHQNEDREDPSEQISVTSFVAVQGDGNRQRCIAAADVDEEALPVAGWFDLAGPRDHVEETLCHAGAKTTVGRDAHGHQCAVDR